jgi:hypothetical protein
VSEPEIVHHLIHETTEKHEYDRERALRVYETLKPELEIGRSWGGHEGYAPTERDTDDDRIIVLFELLDGSTFGDWIFGALDFDHGVKLETRKADE